MPVVCLPARPQADYGLVVLSKPLGDVAGTVSIAPPDMSSPPCINFAGYAGSDTMVYHPCTWSPIMTNYWVRLRCEDTDPRECLSSVVLACYSHREQLSQLLVQTRPLPTVYLLFNRSFLTVSASGKLQISCFYLLFVVKPQMNTCEGAKGSSGGPVWQYDRAIGSRSVVGLIDGGFSGGPTTAVGFTPAIVRKITGWIAEHPCGSG